MKSDCLVDKSTGGANLILDWDSDWTIDEPINWLADQMITCYPAINLSNQVSSAH